MAHNPLQTLDIPVSNNPQLPFIPDHPENDPYSINLSMLVRALSENTIQPGSPQRGNPSRGFSRTPDNTIRFNTGTPNPRGSAPANYSPLPSISRSGLRFTSAPPQSLPQPIPTMVSPRSASVSAPSRRRSITETVGDEANDPDLSVVIPVQAPYTHAEPNGTPAQMAAPRGRAAALSPNKKLFGQAFGSARFASPTNPAEFTQQFGSDEKSFIMNISCSGTPLRQSQVTQRLPPGAERAKFGDIYIHVIAYDNDSGRDDRLSCWLVDADENGLPTWTNVSRHYIRNDALIHHPGQEASSFVLHCRDSLLPNYISPATISAYKSKWNKKVEKILARAGRESRRTRSLPARTHTDEEEMDVVAD